MSEECEVVVIKSNVVKMRFLRATVNTNVYRSDNINLKTIYIGKHMFDYPPPDEIIVTVEKVEADQ